MRIRSSKSESNLRSPQLSPVASEDGSTGYPRTSSARSRTTSGRVVEIDHPWETCPFRTLLLVVQDMLALKYGLQLDETDFVTKAKARCAPELQPEKLVAALNAEPALKVKEDSNERLLQLRLETTEIGSFEELQSAQRRWPGTACVLAAVGLAGVGRNVQLVAPYRQAYGTKNALVARLRPKSNGGLGPLHTFGKETFNSALLLEPMIEKALKYQAGSSALMELQSPVECPDFGRAAAVDTAEAALAERFLGALAALAPASTESGAAAACLLAKELMARHPEVVEMQIAGCKVLSSWLGHCQKLSTQQCCTTMEAITAAMRRHSEDARVLEAGAAAMSGTTSSPELQAAAATNGAVEVVVAAMRRCPGDSELLASGCGALAGLSANHPLNQSSIMAQRSIEVIVDAMTRFAKHARLQTMALGALGNLAANNPNNQAAIAEADGLQRVKVALQQHQSRPTVLTAALAALWCLLRRHAGNTEAAVQLGLAEMATAALRRHPLDQRLKTMASGALQCLVPGLSQALADARSSPCSVRQAEATSVRSQV